MNPGRMFPGAALIRVRSSTCGSPSRSRGLPAATVAPAEVIAAVRTVRRVGAVVIPLVEAADIRAEAEDTTKS